ncbi:DUF84 family protein [Thalassobacillus sp. C254]|uniref:DUF84 family protein n=1 Tax=Thalassobacillus sp. C254 TaxID=1225341 RepID=UPI0006D06A9C|nr:DUF84 family protein [Thalassobacillus sp. C254]
MLIGVGSTNNAKLKAVEDALQECKIEIQGINAPSQVRDQPLTDEETKEGAVNRAIYCIKQNKDIVIGIGLEGGVTKMEDGLFLCNWGALADQEGRIVTASGARILLPENAEEDIEAGLELKDIIEKITGRKNVHQSEGAAGLLTAGFVHRNELFSHVIRLLYGQWLYQKAELEGDQRGR